MSTSSISIDEFQALEQKVLRAVEIVRRERDARAAAEAQAAEAETQCAALREKLDAITASNETTQAQISNMSQERDAVRQRVEKMLQQMDELL